MHNGVRHFAPSRAVGKCEPPLCAQYYGRVQIHISNLATKKNILCLFDLVFFVRRTPAQVATISLTARAVLGTAIVLWCRPYRTALWKNVFDPPHRSGDPGQTLKGFLCAEPRRKLMALTDQALCGRLSVCRRIQVWFRKWCCWGAIHTPSRALRFAPGFCAWYLHDSTHAGSVPLLPIVSNAAYWYYPPDLARSD